jgi:hypothetical protein
VPVRFVGLGSYSLNLEVFAYLTTCDNDEFIVLQQDLLLKILHAVEASGTALAVPVQENIRLNGTPKEKIEQGIGRDSIDSRQDP